MTKNTKTLLTVAGVAVVGYLLYTQFRKKSGSKSFAGFTADDDFFNVVGRTRISGADDIFDCPKCNKQGKCYSIVPTTDATIAAGIAGQKAIADCTPLDTSARTFRR